MSLAYVVTTASPPNRQHWVTPYDISKCRLRRPNTDVKLLPRYDISHDTIYPPYCYRPNAGLNVGYSFTLLSQRIFTFYVTVTSTCDSANQYCLHAHLCRLSHLDRLPARQPLLSCCAPSPARRDSTFITKQMPVSRKHVPVNSCLLGQVITALRFVAHSTPDTNSSAALTEFICPASTHLAYMHSTTNRPQCQLTSLVRQPTLLYATTPNCQT